jgi:hypothetical protein
LRVGIEVALASLENVLTIETRAINIRTGRFNRIESVTGAVIAATTCKRPAQLPAVLR